MRGAGRFGRRAAVLAVLIASCWSGTAFAGPAPQVSPGRYQFNAALAFAYGFDAPSHILQGGQTHFGPNGEVDVDACRQPKPGQAACFARDIIEEKILERFVLGDRRLAVTARVARVDPCCLCFVRLREVERSEVGGLELEGECAAVLLPLERRSDDPR